MILFFPGVFLLFQNCLILQVESAGQRFQVDAHQYRNVYKTTLKLGDCPIRRITYPNGTQQLIKCSYKYTGDEYFIPLAEATFDVKRVKTTEDMVSRIGGGITIGAGVAGLISAEIKGSVTVDTQTTKKQLTLSSSYRLQRGVMALRNARPAGPLPAHFPTELYLSEIVLGGTEMLFVTMEFESEKTKTEVEVTVTVKILWISLSAKLRYISENFKQSASVKVARFSTWEGPKTNKFIGLDSLEKATELVEKYEREIEAGPSTLLNMAIDDDKLQAEYYFSTWDRSSEEYKLNEALAIAQLETLLKQIVELDTIKKKINAYINYGRSSGKIPQKKIEELSTYETDLIDDKLGKLKLAYLSYFLMNQEERGRIAEIYGRSLAPFHYTRKLNRIFQPGDDFTYIDHTD